MSKKTNGALSSASLASLRVFVGTSPGGEDAEACMVLEHSLRARASVPVEIEWARLSHDPASPFSGWRTERWGSPWTALRWAVPAACGWRGRAIYFDCPQLVLGDVAALVRAPMPAGAFVLLRRPRGASIETACMVFDCAEAHRHLPSLAQMRADVGAHQEVGHLLERRWRLAGALPFGWGVADFDAAQDPKGPAGSVYFASAYTQPHAPRALARLARAGRSHWFDEVRLPHYCAALVAQFEAEYAAAVAAGRSPEEYVPEEAYGPLAIRGHERARIES